MDLQTVIAGATAEVISLFRAYLTQIDDARKDDDREALEDLKPVIRNDPNLSQPMRKYLAGVIKKKLEQVS